MNVNIVDPLFEYRCKSLKRAQERAQNPEWKELWANKLKELQKKYQIKS